MEKTRDLNSKFLGGRINDREDLPKKKNKKKYTLILLELNEVIAFLV